MKKSRWGLLRERGEGGAPVTPIELFFDLVYVFAVTQLTHHLLRHLSVQGACETLLLLLAVWSAWMYTSWITNWFDPTALPVRLMLVALMLGSLIMSASIPEAFGARGLGFAAAYVAIQIGRTVFVLAALGRSHALTSNFQRVLIWLSATGVLWLGGGATHDDLRIAIWLVAVALEFAAAWRGFPVPGLGRTPTMDWTIAGEHLAERCELFVILALGESIVVTGAGFSELPASAETVVAFAVAFVGSVGLWWIYFDRGAEAGRRAMTTTPDPGRLARTYSYFLIPMVAGIIVTAGADEVMIAHPTEGSTVAATALILGGPALYLAGNALFNWAVTERLLFSRLVALSAIAALVPLAVVSSQLLLGACATLVVVGVALWDMWR